MKKKNTQCYVVLRLTKDDTSHNPHVLGVFESLIAADVYCGKCNDTYAKTLNDRLYAIIQTSNFEADV